MARLALRGCAQAYLVGQDEDEERVGLHQAERRCVDDILHTCWRGDNHHVSLPIEPVVVSREPLEPWRGRHEGAAVFGCDYCGTQRRSPLRHLGANAPIAHHAYRELRDECVVGCRRGGGTLSWRVWQESAGPEVTCGATELILSLEYGGNGQ